MPERLVDFGTGLRNRRYSLSAPFHFRDNLTGDEDSFR